MFDLEMIKGSATARGSRTIRATSQAPGRASRRPTLLDYLPKDHLMIIDESHVSVPAAARHVLGRPLAQGDAGRVRLRLPSALDNRPLRFEEFEERVASECTSSATPGPYELGMSKGEVIEQVIRPTGLRTR